MTKSLVFAQRKHSLVHVVFYYACDVTLSVYPHRTSFFIVFILVFKTAACHKITYRRLRLHITMHASR